MIQTVEAVINSAGRVRLLGEVQVGSPSPCTGMTLLGRTAL